MKISKHLLWLPLATMLAACSDSDPADSAKTEEKSASATVQAPASANSCIADFAERPCELFTLERVRNSYPELPELVVTADALPTSTCQHSWPSERTRLVQVGDIEVETPLENRIAISWINKRELAGAAEQFELTYRTLSEEEKAATLAALDAQLEKQSAELTAEQKTLAGNIGRDLIEATQFEPVENLGSAAAWDAGERGKTLKVLDRDTEFGIDVDVSDDNEQNRAIAIELARALMATCP